MSKPGARLTIRDVMGRKQELEVVSPPVVRQPYVVAETEHGRIRVDVKDVVGWVDERGDVHVPGW